MNTTTIIVEDTTSNSGVILGGVSLGILLAALSAAAAAAVVYLRKRGVNVDQIQATAKAVVDSGIADAALKAVDSTGQVEKAVHAAVEAPLPTSSDLEAGVEKVAQVVQSIVAADAPPSAAAPTS